ncbi:MAG: hypothetical protein ACI8RD_014044 [Bacillariaceae sp.]|jgi:hypothetical protein
MKYTLVIVVVLYYCITLYSTTPNMIEFPHRIVLLSSQALELDVTGHKSMCMYFIANTVG